MIPWWLLLPQGVSGAIKRRAGVEPFREVGRMGAIPLGGAVETGAGKLRFKAIIHVAGINLLWRSSEWSVRESIRIARHQRGMARVSLDRVATDRRRLGGGSCERVEVWMARRAAENRL